MLIIYAINPVCTEEDDDDVDDKINGLYKFIAAKNSQCERYARTNARTHTRVLFKIFWTEKLII